MSPSRSSLGVVGAVGVVDISAGASAIAVASIYVDDAVASYYATDSSCCDATSFWPSFPNEGLNFGTTIIVSWRNQVYSSSATF